MLRQHIDFLIDRHAHFFGSDAIPVLPEDPFSTEWTRDALRAVVTRGVGHITQVTLSCIPGRRPLLIINYIRAICYGMLSATGRSTTFQLFYPMKGPCYIHACPCL